MRDEWHNDETLRENDTRLGLRGSVNEGISSQKLQATLEARSESVKDARDAIEGRLHGFDGADEVKIADPVTFAPKETTDTPLVKSTPVVLNCVFLSFL